MEQTLSITEQITVRLLHELRTGIYKAEHRLPPEQEIAAFLHVSRTAVRDALAVLEREGFISRKRGVGTIINQYVLQVQTRMDLEQEFLDMIAAVGKTPTAKLLGFEEIPADADAAARLGIPVGEPILAISRLIYADGVPAIYCTDLMAKSRIQNPEYTAQDINTPVFDFMNRFCGISVHMDVTEVRAVAADRHTAKIMDVPLAEPLLYLNETGYTLRGEPVLNSREYYADGILTHTVLRKKI